MPMEPIREGEVPVGAETEDLEDLTKADLQARAAELEISGRSSMTKDELVEAIEEAETAPQA